MFNLPTMPTISFNSIISVLKIFKFKKMVEKSFINPPRTKKLKVPKYIANTFNLTACEIMQHAVITIQPKQNCGNSHVLFFHGGAYLLEGNTMHWKIVENIALNANCRVSYIDYPLAPENTYKVTFEMVRKSFDKLTTDFPDDKFIFMGDSAGGGLALAFAQKLFYERGLIQPTKLILFSPWLDLSMQHSGIKKQVELDFILPLDGLIQAGLKYAGGDDVMQYLLSPINGELKGLGETMVFYGTHELFYPDCLKLKNMTNDSSNFHFQEFEGMQHDWVIFPISEAKQALKIAVEFINS